MKQKEYILEYIDKFGSVIPAKMGGKTFVASDNKEYLFPSEIGKRCREMRAAGILDSEPDKDNPKFERFFRVRQEKIEIKQMPEIDNKLNALFSWKSDNNNHPLA